MTLPQENIIVGPAPSTMTHAQLVNYRVVGFSGTRHLENPELIRAKLRAALRDLSRFDDAQWVAMSSAAIGGDLLFVTEALEMGLPWIAVLPFPEETFFNGKDFQDPTVRTQAQQILSRAADVEVIQVPKSSAQAEDPTWRRAAFADAGFRCVDDSDVLIVVFDQTRGAGKPGGTGGVVSYARSRKKPLLIVNSRTGEVSVENWSAPPSDPLTKQLQHLGNVAPNEKERSKLPSNAAALEIAGWRKAFGKEARKHKIGVRWINTAVVALHLGAIIITAFVASFKPNEPEKHVLELTSFGAVFIGFALLLWLLRDKPHARGANYRFAAEIGRSLLAVWNIPRAALGVIPSPPKTFQHFVRTLTMHYRLDPTRRHETEMAVLSEAELSDLARRYVADRVDDQRKRYYSPNFRRSRSAAHVLERISVIFSGIALCSAGVLAFHPFGGNTDPWVFVKLASAAAAPFALSLLVIHEVRRRAARYYEMSELLKEYGIQISQVRTFRKLQELVIEVERLLLSETFEWWILAKENVAA